MCSPATCPRCGKTTWTGCGNHIEQALAGVPAAQRCSCDSAASANGASEAGIFGRMFGR